jgi:hypothetical protein
VKGKINNLRASDTGEEKSSVSTLQSSSKQREKLLTEPEWCALIPEEQWSVSCEALDVVIQAGVFFLIGGGFGVAAYTGRWRNTKDIDLYILPGQQDKVIQALTNAGFQDFYSTRPYDRGWIYRAVRDGNIVDVIWQFANRRAQVDQTWFDNAPTFDVKGRTLKVIPPEELIWSKLYVLQGDHSDWPDIINVLYAIGPKLDWDHLWQRVGPDAALLEAVLTVFSWVAPTRVRALASKIQKDWPTPLPSPLDEKSEADRVKLLDSRTWFAGLLPTNKMLEI